MGVDFCTKKCADSSSTEAGCDEDNDSFAVGPYTSTNVDCAAEEDCDCTGDCPDVPEEPEEGSQAASILQDIKAWILGTKTLAELLSSI